MSPSILRGQHAPGVWRPGVGARLLLAFFGISAFAALAAAAGIYAFREVGGRLAVVDTRVPPTLSALELSRSAERIIAAAPALLAATDRARRDEVKAALSGEVGRLHETLADLRRGDPEPPSLEAIAPLVAALAGNLARLDDVVARRLDTNDRIRALRRGVFQTNDETQRLLAPWIEVLGAEVAVLIAQRRTEAAQAADAPQHLASLVEAQRLMARAQAQVSSVADMLAEASTADQPRRLAVLAFQLRLALRELEALASGLGDKPRPLFLDQVAKLRGFADGPSAIAEARRQELALVAEGGALLDETARLSAELTRAVDALGSAAKRDIAAAIRNALFVQRVSTRALVVLVGLSLLTSGLIVWLYVRGNIVRRLTALSEGMLAIAGGRLRAPVPADGTDEIAAMARAVEIFRRNTVERDGLLAEKAAAADRLEREVEERTAELAAKSRELESANRYKSQFLASASHDLRQPLHALNLFAAQLRTEPDPEERRRLVARINAAVGAMNELFEALLDMSKLEAGVLKPNVAAFAVAPLLARIETTFAQAAREKGLRLRVVPSGAWVRSDFILLERILLNLVGNAVRYTARGGVVVGCRRRGADLRIDVCDSGPGIPCEQQRTVFEEFVQLAPQPDRRGGLGLGLAIVDRLGRLLGHDVAMNSGEGRGSRFSVTVPLAGAVDESIGAPVALPATDSVRRKRVVVIDDDALVLEGMGGILRNWGCDVVAEKSEETALATLRAQRMKPDLIISDYRLADGRTGIEAIERLRGALGPSIPAFLISGDTAPERLRDASASGYHLLHKPVAPIRLRAIVNQLTRTAESPQAPPDGASVSRRPAAAARSPSPPRQ